ncbi:hypothetical protein J6590_095651 [Homalodisca vitripennis]|nr:hypothetical protein J6590_095651 [Homalodisca vitripennis]
MALLCPATKEEHRLEIPIPNTLRQLKPTHTHSGDKPAGHQLAATKANNESEPFLPHGRSVVGDSSTAIPTTLVITGFSRAPRLPVYVLLWSLTLPKGEQSASFGVAAAGPHFQNGSWYD